MYRDIASQKCITSIIVIIISETISRRNCVKIIIIIYTRETATVIMYEYNKKSHSRRMSKNYLFSLLITYYIYIYIIT